MEKGTLHRKLGVELTVIEDVLIVSFKRHDDEVSNLRNA
jgi:hypothetical protein